MFESCMSMKTTAWAQGACGVLQKDYFEAWQGLVSHFTPHSRDGMAKEAKRKAPLEGEAGKSTRSRGK
jgi:hypothetical protein